MENSNGIEKSLDCENIKWENISQEFFKALHNYEMLDENNPNFKPFDKPEQGKGYIRLFSAPVSKNTSLVIDKLIFTDQTDGRGYIVDTLNFSLEKDGITIAEINLHKDRSDSLNSFRISHRWVDPKFRNQKISTNLLKHGVLNFLKQRANFSKNIQYVTSSMAQPHVIKFFKKNGFQENSVKDSDIVKDIFKKNDRFDYGKSMYGNNDYVVRKGAGEEDELSEKDKIIVTLSKRILPHSTFLERVRRIGKKVKGILGNS